MAKAALKNTASNIALINSDNVPEGSVMEPINGDTGTEIKGEMQGPKLPATVGDNKPPAIVSYHPVTPDKEHAVLELMNIGKDFRKSAEVLGSKFDALALMITDYAFFLFEESAAMNKGIGKVPTFDELKKKVKLILDGKLSVEASADNLGKLRVFNVVETDEQKKEREKANKDRPAGLRDISETFENIPDSTINQYYPVACMAALLVLYGNETVQHGKDIITETGTTYRKGWRWTHTENGHNAGDAMLIDLGTAKAHKWVPRPTDGDAGEPEGAHMGIIFHDHLIHPKVEVSFDAKENRPDYKPRANLAKYMNKPYVGLTMKGAVLDFERFFGTTKGERVDTDLNTGFVYVEGRKPRQPGTGDNDNPPVVNQGDNDNPPVPPVDGSAPMPVTIAAMPGNLTELNGAGEEARKAFWPKIAGFFKSLPVTPKSYNEDELSFLADIRLKIAAIIELADGEDDEQVRKAMGEK